jgi:hypothetical protein
VAGFVLERFLWGEDRWTTTGQVSLHGHVEENIARERLSMRKLKEVLRLRFELGLGHRQIARSCSIGRATIHEYLKRAQAAGVGWPLPEDWE